MEPDLRSRISLRSIQATKRRNRCNGRLKDRPHPCPSLDRTGFAIDVTTFLQARDPFAVARQKNSRAKTRRENGGACHESPQRLAQRTPSPQRGEGRGEGVRASQSEPPCISANCRCAYGASGGGRRETEAPLYLCELPLRVWCEAAEAGGRPKPPWSRRPRMSTAPRLQFQ